MEHIQGFHLLTRSDELNRLVHHAADTQCRSTTGVTVQLRQNDAVKIQTVIKLFCGIDCILSGHGIYHEQRLRRRDSFFDSRYLVHHLLVHSQTTGGIDDHYIVAEFLCFGNSILRFLHWVRLAFSCINFRLDLLTQHTQLLDSCRTIYVTSHQHHFLTFLRLQVVSQFRSKSGLTGTLQTGHQNNGRITFEVDFLRFTAHESRQLVMCDLHHQLSGTNRGDHVLTQGFLFHLVGKLFSGFVVHIRFQQCLTDVLDRLRNIDFSNTAFTFQDLERPF